MSDAKPASPLILTPVAGVGTIRSGTDLASEVAAALRTSGISLENGDILVLAQKIVSKAENRFVRLCDVVPSIEALRLAEICRKDPRLVELILRESSSVLRCKPNIIIVRHSRGWVMANAGIDASNVEPIDGEETVLLLPADPDLSAERLRLRLQEDFGVDIGLAIIDSFGRAWRMGTTGTAIGLAGLPGLLDLRGRPDRNGRLLMTTEVGAADELAAAASLLMGQAGEGRPVIHVRGFPYPRRAGTAAELIRPAAMDLFP